MLPACICLSLHNWVPAWRRPPGCRVWGTAAGPSSASPPAPAPTRTDGPRGRCPSQTPPRGRGCRSLFRSNVGMKTDKNDIYALKSNPGLIYLLCSFHSLFLMWVILVQAASVTLGFTFQGSWQPEMTPVWNLDLYIKHCLWLSTTIDQDKCPSCSLHSPHMISLLCWVR